MKRLVFLGSPPISASVLGSLLDASSSPNSFFEVAAIVTQLPSGRDRGIKVLPSTVAQHALDRGFPSDLIFTPERAGEETFLPNFKILGPELCVMAAYGNILPSKFLKIPSLGTVNIHPSILTLYHGTAPVQRALQNLFIACEGLEVDDHIKAPELLDLLFA